MKKWKLMTKSFVVCIVFSVISMVGMAVFFIQRNQLEEPGELFTDAMIMEENGSFEKNGQTDNLGYICIPLPAEMTEEKIEIINDRSSHKIMVTMKNVPEDFFYHHSLSGSNQYITRQMYGYAQGVARLDFELSRFCEYEKRIESNHLYLKFLPPSEMYPYIVVLDAGHGGEDAGTVVYQVEEKSVALNTVLKTGEKLESAGVRVYYTRADDNMVDTEERIRLADEVQADLFVSIHCNADSKTRVTKGIEILAKRPYENLAGCMEEELEAMSATVRREFVDGIPILDGLEVPSVMVQTGYLTNKQEALRLTDEKYLDKMADCIYNGIMQVYEGAEK